MTDNAIVPVNENAIIRPVQSVDQALATYQDMVTFTQKAMTKDQDYGVIPGTEKPTLYKPGAEKLCRFFGLSSKIRIDREVENWEADEPFFYYRVHCTIYRMGTDIVVAEGMGSCNSRESKYGYRWVDETEVPPNLDTTKLPTRRSSKAEFQFAIEKAETTGKYGKPAEYWQEFQAAIEDGAARAFMKKTKSGSEYPAWEIAAVKYRVPNEDIASQVNTILKMAKKRAFIDATLTATNASEFYTQDMEDYDFSPSGDIVDSTAVPVNEEPQAAPEKPKLVEPPPANGDTPPPGAGVPIPSYDSTFPFEPDKKLCDFDSADWTAFYSRGPKLFGIPRDAYRTVVHESLGVESGKESDKTWAEAQNIISDYWDSLGQDAA